MMGRSPNPFFPRFVLAVCLTLAGLAGIASASQQLTLDSVQISSGGLQPVTLTLDKGDAGLSGYTLVLAVDDPDIARIESWTAPSWADMSENGTLPAASTITKAAALTITKVPSGSQNISLGTVTIRGVTPGKTSLHISLERLEDNNGDDYISSTAVIGGAITVTGNSVAAAVTPLSLPGQANPPKDPLGNGMMQDLNGDGTVSSTDVSLYFTNFDWIQNNEPVALFDYNNNGIIDFGDIVTLNEKVQAYR